MKPVYLIVPLMTISAYLRGTLASVVFMLLAFVLALINFVYVSQNLKKK